MKARIKFTKDHYVYKAGKEITLADCTAKALVDSGVATLVIKKK